MEHGAVAVIQRMPLNPQNRELTLVGGVDDTDMVSGSGGRTNLSDKDLVEAVLRELSEAADKWEAFVAQAETVTYSVDLGDIRAVANSDGRLVELTLHPGVMTGYAHAELADRLNLAIAALRDEAEAENRARYGGELH
ncbi:MAG: hypothetical protein QOE30_4898 [Mycobacterium sp.]|nr:hypothetical protein [Mycobacterium sp.]